MHSDVLSKIQKYRFDFRSGNLVCCCGGAGKRMTSANAAAVNRASVTAHEMKGDVMSSMV